MALCFIFDVFLDEHVIVEGSRVGAYKLILAFSNVQLETQLHWLTGTI